MKSIYEMTAEEVEIAEMLTIRPALLEFMQLCMTLTDDERKQVLKMCEERAQQYQK